MDLDVGEAAADFVAAAPIDGARHGFVFRVGEHGIGYYSDVGATKNAHQQQPARYRYTCQCGGHQQVSVRSTRCSWNGQRGHCLAHVNGSKLLEHGRSHVPLGGQVNGPNCSTAAQACDALCACTDGSGDGQTGTLCVCSVYHTATHLCTFYVLLWPGLHRHNLEMLVAASERGSRDDGRPYIPFLKKIFACGGPEKCSETRKNRKHRVSIWYIPLLHLFGA